MKNILKYNEIGIPRALSYYNNFPFYQGFFEALGVSVIVSDKTTDETISAGCRVCAPETCFPVKVFAGHVLNLLEKGVHNIFIPSIQSIGCKINYCSKIRGLPDIIRNIIDIPFNIIEPELNLTEKKDFHVFWRETAEAIGITDKKEIKRAEKAGWVQYNKFLEAAAEGLSYDKAVKISKKILPDIELEETSAPVSAAVIAHGYNLFDEKISLNIIKKFKKMNVKVYTHLNAPFQDAIKSINSLGETVYWANEFEMTGTAAYFMLNKKIDGIIALSSFGCGPDSLMINEISFHAAKMNIPVLNLVIDEHTGEAGFVTRLEAFCDMLLRKKRRSLEKYHDLQPFSINFKSTYRKFSSCVSKPQ